MKFKIFFVISFLCIWVSSYACTIISHDFGQHGVYTARTFDFCFDMPYDIAIYPRGLEESGEVSSNKQLVWTSKFASAMVRERSTSVIANLDGMNEKGLGVHVLFLKGSEYEVRDLAKPDIGVYKWAKYVLDNYSSVSEVVNSLDKYQIVNTTVALAQYKVRIPLHFVVEDAKGNNAIFELIDGKLKIYQGKDKNIVTNEPNYDKQLINLAAVKKSSQFDMINLPGGSLPKNRFVRAYYYDSKLPTKLSQDDNPMQLIYSALSPEITPFYADYVQSCKMPSKNADDASWPTQWITILDHKNKVFKLIDMKTGKRFTVDFNKLKLNPGQPVRTIEPRGRTNE